MSEQKIPSHINTNLGKRLLFLRLFHPILDIRLLNYELKIVIKSTEGDHSSSFSDLHLGRDPWFEKRRLNLTGYLFGIKNDDVDIF